MPSVSRRGVLRATGALGVPTVAGCTGGWLDDGTDDPPAGRWPMARYDARNTGAHPTASGPGEDLAERWRWDHDVESAFEPSYSRPVVEDGTVYVTYGVFGGDGEVGVAAVDAASGETAWRTTITEGNASSGPELQAPAVVDGTVYAGGIASDDGPRIAALDAADGDGRWETIADDTESRRAFPRTPPAVDDDRLVFGATTASSFRTDDGERDWLYTGDEDAHPYPAEGPVAVTDDRAYVTTYRGLHAVDDEGRPLWTASAAPGGDGEVRRISAPAVGDDVYLTARPDASDGGALVAVDPDGDERWRYRPADDADEPGETIAFVPTLADGTLYLLGSTTDESDATTMRLYAVDAATGEREWGADVPTPDDSTRAATPVVAGSTVYVLTERALIAVDAAAGDRLADRSVSTEFWFSGPRIGLGVADDALYYTTGHELVAVGP